MKNLIESITVKNAIILAVLIIAGYFFLDGIIELIKQFWGWLLGLFGIGVAVKMKAADRAGIEAEVYKEQADTRIIEAAKEAAEVNRKVQSAVDLTRNQPEPVPEDDKYKRKSIRSW